VSERPEVLFVCVHNADRSQMAAGLLELRSNGRIGARSAGTAPATEIGEAVVAAMGEIGVDVSENVPTLLSDDDVRIADVVVTMGCGDACPVLPGRLTAELSTQEWSEDASTDPRELRRTAEGR
jgi:arsenate reductase